jgi:required for meiotic nuclear division protein 1
MAEDAQARFTPLTARAVLLGERIDTAGLERRDALSTMPLAFRVSESGMAVVFRYGVVVLIGLETLAEDEVLRGLAARVVNPFSLREEESIRLAPLDGREERADTDGVVRIADRSPERMLVVADALAKSAALAHDERQVAEVLDATEPWARHLAERGRKPAGRRAMVRLLGRGLLVQHRVSGRVAVGEKPDLLWDRPDLERLYARMEDEYELVERAEILDRKLRLIGQTAGLMTDLMDTERAHRLELIIVLLIAFEIVWSLFLFARGMAH